jgi:hypothetical protein
VHQVGTRLPFDRLGLSPQLPNIIAHELMHVRDRLDIGFQYSEALRPPHGSKLWSVHFHLWDAYIDGRLGTAAAYTLVERQEEAAETPIGPQDVAAAWHEEFQTYPDLVRRAHRTRVGSAALFRINV